MRALAWPLGLAFLGVACTGSKVSDPGPVVSDPDAGATTEPGGDGAPTSPDAGVTGGGVDGGGTGGGGTTIGGIALGAQIDRVGRVGVNTLLIRTFDEDTGSRNRTRDRYNSRTPKDSAEFIPDLIESLRMWDGVDRNCGNQFLSVPLTIEGRYERLAARLGDDVLYVDTRATACFYYMALETDEAQVVPNADCGGRTLTEDAIDVFYAILTNGMRGPMRDGVAQDDRAHSNEEFPFVAEAGSAPTSSMAPTRPPDSNPLMESSDRSCKNLGYTDAGGGAGSIGFGQACGASVQCAGEDAVCVQNTCFYGGFCTVPCTDGDDRTCDGVGANLACEWVGGSHFCVHKCSSDGDCGRSGYHCGPDGYCISQD